VDRLPLRPKRKPRRPRKPGLGDMTFPGSVKQPVTGKRKPLTPRETPINPGKPRIPRKKPLLPNQHTALGSNTGKSTMEAAQSMASRLKKQFKK
jgi:hypothetical protein